MDKGIANRLRRVLELAKAIKAETMPIENHPDTGAIKDCWNEIEEQLKESIDHLHILSGKAKLRHKEAENNYSSTKSFSRLDYYRGRADEAESNFASILRWLHPSATDKQIKTLTEL